MLSLKEKANQGAREFEARLNEDYEIPKNVGWYVLFCKETKFTRYGHSLSELLNKYALNPKLDYYTSYNTFKNWKHHSNSNVLGLNAVWQDFDCLNNGIPINVFEYAIPQLLGLMKLPKPKHVVMTGGGFHFVWFFSTPKITHSSSFTKLWRRLEKQIIKIGQEACKDLFQEPNICDDSVKNESRLMRIVGSYNNKRGNSVLVRRVPQYESHDLYTMQWFIDNYLPPLTHNKKKDTSHKRFRLFLKKHPNRNLKHNANTLNWNRYYDLKHLVIMRKGKMNGLRDLTLFTIACQLYYVIDNPSKIASIVKSVNKLFSDPLPETQMGYLCDEIIDIDFTNYRLHTNKWLIQTFKITPQEQDNLKTIKIAKKSTDQLHHQNHIKKMKYLKHRDKLVINFHNKKISNRKIAKKVNLSRQTINRIVKAHKRVAHS